MDISDPSSTIILNNYINQDNSDIKLLDTKPFDIISPLSQNVGHFTAKYLRCFLLKIKRAKSV